jgi:parvulin-like peptidyl-prolyl isomerase
VVPTDDDHRRYYREHRAELPPVQRVRLKMILILERERAESVHRSLLAGKPWDELAGAYSVEANAARGGDLGWLFVHQLTSDYRQQVLELKPGGVTAPFNQGGRWVILKLAEREGQRPPTEEEARGLLAASVLEKKRGDFLKDYSARLRKEYKVKIDEAALERVRG